MQMKSLNGCRLKIGSYPSFNYNASGGGGKATLLPSKKSNLLQVSFSSKTFSIPPLTSKTTKFLSDSENVRFVLVSPLGTLVQSGVKIGFDDKLIASIVDFSAE